MAIKKYSMGGPITSVEDKDTMESREENPAPTAECRIVVCNKCDIQHMLLPEELSRKCACGNIVRFN